MHANLLAIGLPGKAWSAVVTAEDVAERKPAPDIFRKAARRMGVPPEQCLVVEDAPSGIQAARAAGMPCVAVATSFKPEQIAGADRVVDSMAGLLRIMPRAARTVTPGRRLRQA